MQIGVQSQPQDNESGLAVLLTLPLSFLGLGTFRAWMWLLPVLSPQAPALEQFHDLLLCAALLLLAALARKVVPIGLNRWAQIVCGITAFAGSSIIALNVAMPFAPAASYVGIAFVALAAAIVILSWCELYACLDIARIALCLALAFLTEQALIFLLEGLPLPYRLGALFLLPATALLSLQRAYTYLPDSMRPRPVPGKLRIPWKLIALLAAYLFVSGVRAGMATSPVNPFSGAASTLVALFLILAIAFFLQSLRSRVCLPHPQLPASMRVASDPSPRGRQRELLCLLSRPQHPAFRSCGVPPFERYLPTPCHYRRHALRN